MTATVFYNAQLVLKDDVVPGWSYRVDGTNLPSQLKTMSRIRSALPFESPRLLKHQRLSDEPFYFKFCERRRIKVIRMNVAYVNEIRITSDETFPL